VRPNPRLYELHAPAWLERQSRRFGQRLTLASVPDEAWRDLAALGFDLVWVMGVWRRSPAGRELALASSALREAWDAEVQGWSADDVLGSPYAVLAYQLDPGLGSPEDLALLRDRLHRLGLGLVLDFVPNHLALDHPWTRTHPGRFVRGDERAVARHPDWFFRGPDGSWLAHGRDPYFAPWSDTVQIDYASADARAALASQLEAIAGVADGVRCDMAMLGLDEVIERTWSEVLPARAEPAPDFWTEIVGRVRERHPGVILIAEAYWDLEPELLRRGFDYAYDKTVYDLLLADRVAELRERIARGDRMLARGVHFTENHDEPRAATAFGPARSRAAAAVTLTLPGMRLVHDGQLEGTRTRAPIHLRRANPSEGSAADQAFHRSLLETTAADVFRDGRFTPLGAAPPVLAWAWVAPGTRRVVAVNWSGAAVEVAIDTPADLGFGPPNRFSSRLESWSFCILPAEPAPV